ncbi:unnamed protein product [Owenia fusiformis]|uniref:Uncharacterized protein n=1 Tax=Owenia fusiformis TaxID=6347 RepID=A0A8J1XKD0_OWEFU|nr:unnamed protein product [Owenia fusiformis]
MPPTLSKDEKLEQRAVIKFLQKTGGKPSDTIKEFKQAYAACNSNPEACMSYNLRKIEDRTYRAVCELNGPSKSLPTDTTDDVDYFEKGAPDYCYYQHNGEVNVGSVDTFRAQCRNGWLVFANRYNGSVDFNKNWTDYKNGFGSIDGEYFLGFDKILSILIQGSHKLRVELTTWPDKGNVMKYAEYGSFNLTGENDYYRLSVSDHSGTVADMMGPSNGKQFTTDDEDRDEMVGNNCASIKRGPWCQLISPDSQDSEIEDNTLSANQLGDLSTSTHNLTSEDGISLQCQEGATPPSSALRRSTRAKAPTARRLKTPKTPHTTQSKPKRGRPRIAQSQPLPSKSSAATSKQRKSTDTFETEVLSLLRTLRTSLDVTNASLPAVQKTNCDLVSQLAAKTAE